RVKSDRGAASDPGQGPCRPQAARHSMAPERRGPRIGAAPGLATRARFAGRGGTLPGARPDQRTWRRQGHPRRLDHRRPGRPAAPGQRRLRSRARPVARGAAVSQATSPVRLSEEKLARAALTYLAEPGDPALGALLGICEPAEVLAAIKADMLPGSGPGCRTTRASRAPVATASG